MWSNTNIRRKRSSTLTSVKTLERELCSFGRERQPWPSSTNQPPPQTRAESSLQWTLELLLENIYVGQLKTLFFMLIKIYCSILTDQDQDYHSVKYILTASSVNPSCVQPHEHPKKVFFSSIITVTSLYYFKHRFLENRWPLLSNFCEECEN